MPQAVRYRTEWMGGGTAQAGKAVTVRNIADTADATTYTSSAGTTTGTNPINTDSAGLFSTYLAPGRYLLKDASGAKLEITVGTPGPDTPTPDAVTGVVPAGPLKQVLTILAAKGILTDNTTLT